MLQLLKLPSEQKNVVLPPPGTGIVCTGEWLESTLEYFVEHLSVCLPLLIQPLLRNFLVLDWNRYEGDHYDAVR